MKSLLSTSVEDEEKQAKTPINANRHNSSTSATTTAEFLEEGDYDEEDPQVEDSSTASLKHQKKNLRQGRHSRKKFYHYAEDWCNKGDVGNAISFILMVVSGITIMMTKNEDNTNGKQIDDRFIQCVFSAGLFGFAGGFTNWLAVKMLFDRIPFLYGSGVIPRQFKAVRETVKDTIMETFFDPEFLQNYMAERSHELLEKMDFKTIVQTLLDKPGSDQLITDKLTSFSEKPEGMMISTLASMFGGIGPMVPMLKPLMINLTSDLAEMLTQSFDPCSHLMSIDKVIQEIDNLMTEKLELLTPQIVKELMEHVIREHLGWLVVWGNLFGALIGLLSLALGYSTSNGL